MTEYIHEEKSKAMRAINDAIKVMVDQGISVYAILWALNFEKQTLKQNIRDDRAQENRETLEDDLVGIEHSGVFEADEIIFDVIVERHDELQEMESLK